LDCRSIHSGYGMNVVWLRQFCRDLLRQIHRTLINNKIDIHEINNVVVTPVDRSILRKETMYRTSTLLGSGSGSQVGDGRKGHGDRGNWSWFDAPPIHIGRVYGRKLWQQRHTVFQKIRCEKLTSAPKPALATFHRLHAGEALLLQQSDGSLRP